MTSNLFKKTAVKGLAAAILATASLSSTYATELLPRIPAAKNSAITTVANSAEYEKIVVKFKEGTGVSSNYAGLLPQAEVTELPPSLGIDLNELNAQLEQINQYVASLGLNFSDLFNIDTSILQDLKAKGEANTGKQLADLTLYFELPTYGLTNTQIQQVVDSLNSYTSIEISYAEPKAEVAAITPDFQDYDPNDSSKKFQGYLNAASENGIDAKYAWTIAGGKGEGVKVVDVEGGWQVTHEDFPPVFFSAGDMYSSESWVDHGSAVMGVMGGQENGYGVTGIAPNAQFGYSSIGGQGTATAITSAANAVGAGGIVLIELHRGGPTLQESCSCNNGQCNYIAMEYWQAEYDAISTATANGVIVVEAAGNGSADLDDPIYDNKFDRNFRDSGAIVVGASSSTSTAPMCWTNNGTRVDVHGWGENVVTMGYGNIYTNPDDPNNKDYEYTGYFSGTSSASPVVVGAVAAIQGVSKANNGETLTSYQIRDLLTQTGTQQDINLDVEIGPLPNLKAAIDVLLGAAVCTEFTATNSEHETAGRAYSETKKVGETCYGTFCFGGTDQTTWFVTDSAENLGTDGDATTVIHKNSDGTFAQGICPTPDVTAPIITLLGDNPLDIFQGGDFTDPGATAADDRDGDITAQINTNSNVNTAALGQYQVTYDVTDAAGNAAATVTRNVNVVPAPACVEFTNTASAHEAAGRAYSETKKEGETCYGTFCFGGTEVTTWYATGSAENLGTSGSATITLKEQPAGSGVFVQGNCPTDPQPPVIESYEITTLNNYQAVVTGTASDQDGDIDRVVLGLGAVTGIICEGTNYFTCTLDYSEHDITVGAALGVTLAAYDSREAASNIEQFTITRPENQAPVVNAVNAAISGNTVTITGTASDADNDLKEIILYGEGGGIYCEGLESFTCTITDTAEGEHTWHVKAVDTTLQQSELYAINFVITGQSAPTIDTHQYSQNGSTITFTGTASDPDGDLDRVILTLAAAGGIVCEGTANFTCVFEATQPGTYTLGVVAVDALDNYGEVQGPYEFVVEAGPSCVTDTNTNHGTAGRATLKYNVLYYAAGSNDYLGMANDTTSLEETSTGNWSKVSSCQ